MSEVSLESRLSNLEVGREYALVPLVERLEELGHGLGRGVSGCAMLITILRGNDNFRVNVPEPKKGVDWSAQWTIKRLK
jgi:hypothetical protein